MNTQNMLKEFFYFTKSKFIIFLILAISIYVFMARQDMILGNFSYSILFIFIGVLYLVTSVLWFSFKSKKHFLIGIIVIVILFFTLRYSDNYSSQKRADAQTECMKNLNVTSMNVEVMRCLQSKGYKFYR